MDMDRMHVKPFRSQEMGSVAKPRSSETYASSPQPSRFRRSAPKKKAGRIPRSLLVKLGICIAACVLMLSLKDLDTPLATQMVSGVRSAVNEETDLTEMLGKLQFVELPNALEVFSTDDKMIAPVSAPTASMEEDSQYALWEDAPNAEVIASAAGEVRAIGVDDVLGQYVRLMHEGDLETIYYGLQTVQVEEGQPIRRHDTLGTLGENGTLCLYVLLQGEPQSPGEYFNLVQNG